MQKPALIAGFFRYTGASYDFTLKEHFNHEKHERTRKVSDLLKLRESPKR
jgi:hypothetical protein